MPHTAQRPFRANVTVAVLLSGVAGALNAGGFIVVGTFTSHVTGNWSNMSNALARANLWIAFRFFAFVACFISGAATSGFLIEHDVKRQSHRVRYLKPLILEIALLAAFVVVGHSVASPQDDPLAAITTCILCFTMGLQNAMVTKLSGSVVRTTHMTGISTDLGIELARLVLLGRDRWRAWRRERRSAPEPDLAWEEFARTTRAQFRRELQKAVLLSAILISFALGGVGGTVSFLRWGFLGAVPIALVLTFLVALEYFLVQVLNVDEGVLTGPSTQRLDRSRLAGLDLGGTPALPAPDPPAVTPLHPDLGEGRTHGP